MRCAIRATLLTLLSQVAWTAVTTIHVGMIAQKTGSYARDFLDHNVEIYKEWVESQSNLIAGKEVDMIFHRVDGQSNSETIGATAVAFVKGSWTATYYTPENGFDEEPAQHPMDILIVSWSSAIVPHVLQALEDEGLKLPTYTFGASGESVWMKPDGEIRFDFALQGQGLADVEAEEVLKWLYLQGARSIMVMEEAHAGGWPESVINGARAFAKENGMEIVEDVQIHYPCNDVSDECQEKLIEEYEKLLGPHLKTNGKRKITADVFISWGYNHANICPTQLRYFRQKNANFRSYVFPLCADDASMVKKLANEKDLGDFIISPTGWSGAVDNKAFNEQFSTVSLFSEYGTKSALGYQKIFYDKFNKIPSYIDGWGMTSFYFMHRDLIEADLDFTKMLTLFGDTRRKPMPSFYGWLGTRPGGWNPFHQFLGIQLLPGAEGGQLMAPVEIAVIDGIYPTPTWHDRHCYPNCKLCARCEEIVEAIAWLSLAFLIVAIMLVGILCYLRFVKCIDVRALGMQIGQCFGVVVNVSSDIIAVMITWALVDEELLEIGALYLYVCIVVVSCWLSIIKIRSTCNAAYWCVQKEDAIQKAIKSEKSKRYEGERRGSDEKSSLKEDNYVQSHLKNEQNSTFRATLGTTLRYRRNDLLLDCTLALLCDVPALIIQAVNLFRVVDQPLRTSAPLVVSIVFSFFAIGFASNSLTQFEIYEFQSELLGVDIKLTTRDYLNIYFNVCDVQKNEDPKKLVPSE